MIFLLIRVHSRLQKKMQKHSRTSLHNGPINKKQTAFVSNPRGGGGGGGGGGGTRLAGMSGPMNLHDIRAQSTISVLMRKTKLFIKS